MKYLALILLFAGNIFAQDHLLITEIQTNPSTDSFIEIYNPTATPIALDSVYLADVNTAYQVVNGAPTSNSRDFAVKFPDGSSIPAQGVIVVAVKGSSFETRYGFAADFEIVRTDANVTDMDSIFIGSAAEISRTSEMLLLFYWDGQNDLIRDYDYLAWGTSSTNFMDRSGVVIDGPDADANTSAYQNDTPIANQLPIAAPPFNSSFERSGVTENGEAASAGNGISGHDETSENLAQSFLLNASPTPGSYSVLGPAPVITNLVYDPATVTAGTQVTVSADVTDDGTLTAVELFVALDAGTYNGSPMTLQSGDTYSALIDTQAVGTTVHFFVRATDDAAQQTSSDTLSYTVVSGQAGASHILITEIAVTPTDGEFVEIYNNTNSAIDLSDYYLTDGTFASGNEFYYKIVLGTSEAGGSSSTDFHVRFPAGASIAKGEFQTIALNGSGFVTTYGVQPTYEVSDTDAGIPDMREAFTSAVGSQHGLSNAGEVVILYYWDGATDLVQDVDYVVWGDMAEAVDKSGVSIDGPDADTAPSAYQSDTPISAQKGLVENPHTFGETVQRATLLEVGETALAGNGITGHDETSENMASSFIVGAPNPGSGPAPVEAPQISNVSRSPQTVTSSDDVVVSADVTDNGTVVSVKLFFSIDAAAFDSLDMSLVTGITYQAQIDSQAAGTQVQYFVKAWDDSGLTTSSGIFSYTVLTGGDFIPIADIQNNPGYVGQTVTVEGVVTLGSGLTINTRTDAYVQDESGRGINIFNFDKVDTALVRGNKIRITGSIEEFSGVTEITNYTVEVQARNQSLPAALSLSTGQISDTQFEGTLISTRGVITDMYVAGGGTNILIDDGSGEAAIRIWDTTGLNVSAFATGDTIGCVAVMDVFSSAGQLLAAYDGDIFFTTISQGADGSGVVTVSPDVVGLNQMQTLNFTLQSNSTETVQAIEIAIAPAWGFAGAVNNVALSGAAFAGAQVFANSASVSITNVDLGDGDSGEIQLSGLTSPATDTVSVFGFKTAGSGGTLTAVAKQPTIMVGNGTAVTTVPMDSIIKNIAFWNGKTVSVKGIVTIGSGVLRTDFTSAYATDSTGYSLQVFSFNAPDPDIERGNFVLLRGSIEQFGEIVEITNYTTRILRRDADLPEPLGISTSQLAGLSLVGAWAKISGTIIDKYSAGGGANIIVDDGSGEATIRVWDTAGLDLSDLSVGDGIVASGIVGEFSSAGQLLVGYQEDIGFLVLPKSPILLNVPAKPFAPDRGEKLDIKFSAGSEATHVVLRIYDLGGRLITTLLDDAGRSFEQVMQWNGRDLLNEQVPLGAYILHLEVVDERNGKKTEKMAPIVVGTILK